MNALEGKELYNCSLSSLVTNPFVTQWSEDNHLSIITEKGIHIFELVPSPMTYGSSVKFSRSFVYPSDVLPTDAFTSQLNLILWQWKKEEIYSFLLEETLVPRMNVMTDLVPKVVSLKWSSQGMVHPSKCLLSMISSAGAVDILLKDDCEWFSACDIHSHWLRIVNEEFPDKNFGNLGSEEFKRHIRRLQAVAIVWSNLYENSYSYFVVAYRSGDLLVWKIPAVTDHGREVIPTVTLRTNLNMKIKVDIVEWINIDQNNCLIVMGLFNGKIIALAVSELQGNVTSKQIEIYPEEDLVRISSLKCILLEENKIRLVICKSTFLFVMTIDNTGEILNSMHYQFPAFSITGFSMIDENQFLIFSQDGKLFLAKIENEKINGELIKTDLPKLYSQYLGLSQSYNKLLFATVTSPNTMYDHLVVREPSIFHIFCIDSEKFNPLTILNQNTSKTLLNHWDCFMVIGFKLSKNLMSVNTIDKIPIHFESLPVYELRVLMWLLVLADVYKRKKSLFDFLNVSEELLEIRSLITIYTSSSYLMMIGTKPCKSHEQRLCTRFLRTYLEIYIAGEDDELEMPVCQSADRALKFTYKVEVSGSEVCNLCKNVIVDLPWKTEKCPTGHKLPRCAITFLQITSVRYRSCSICKQIFHSCLDEEYPEGPKCLFCDIPVLHDSRVFGSVDRDRTNFSKRLSTRLKNAEADEGGDEDPDDIYKSKHGKRIRTEVASAKHAHRTFGLPSVPLNPPTEFLKKKSRPLPQKHVPHDHYHRPGYQHKLPSWKPLKFSRKPIIDDLPKDSTLVGRINFRKENILKVKQSEPPEPVPRIVDSRFGDVQDLRTCGLMPMYIKKKYFGKKPPKPKKAPKVKQVRELLKRKSEFEKGKNVDFGNEGKISVFNKIPGRYVTEEERAELLLGMKKNWEELMNQFQRLPFLIDTPPKVKRKLKLENNLKQLEKDIEFIERHPYIYVCDDDE